MVIITIKMWIMNNPKKLTTTIPPLKGPCSQGLNIPDKKVTVINSEKNNNGRYRQVTSKHR
jgi:hypothetical protein